MKYLLALTFFGLLASCGSEENVDSEITTDDIIEEVIEDSLILEEDLGQTIFEVEFPSATSNDPCLPYPSEEFFNYLTFDSLSSKYSSEYNVLYNYVVAHFDSLGARINHPMEDEYDMGTYHWEQDFSNGISFEEFFGGEGGAQATLYTKCTDPQSIYSTINAIVNYPIPTVDGGFDYNGMWNDDLTEYGPEGAGCYYDIMKNDSTGFYYISNYCGC